MMSVRSANLILNEPEAAYYAGQVLSGRLELVMDEPLKYAAINVVFLGMAQVHWTEYEDSGTRGGMRHYLGREVYFDTAQCLSGGQGLNQLNIGTHNFPFEFLIPPHCPSSFVASSIYRGSAKVAYSVKANIIFGPGQQPGKEDQHITKSFQVIAPFDLNLGNESLKEPLILELEQSVSCCFSSGAVAVSVRVPHAGFCPGQDIPITVTATNNSSVEIKGMLFQLIQKERYRATEPVSDMVVPEQVLSSVKAGPVLIKMKQEVTRVLKVPDMIFPNLSNCSIINVGFFLKVKVDLSGCNDSLEEVTEICLGFIPLASSKDSDKYQHPLKNKLPQAPIPEVSSVPRRINTLKLKMQSNTVQSRPFTPTGAYQAAPPPYPIYPGPKSPYPGSNLPVSGPNPPYMGATGSDLSYPTSYSAYPGSNSPYNPGAVPSSHPVGWNGPSVQASAPTVPSITVIPPSPDNTPLVYLPSPNMPYAGSNMPYAGSNMPYADSNMPSVNPSSPNMPYPGSNLPYPSDTGKPGAIGFIIPQPGVPYNNGNRAHSPIPPYSKDTAPSAPSE